MKALVIILLALAAICFVINFIWSKALGEREDKLKKDREGFLKGISSLNKQQAELDKRLDDINTEYSIIGQERERLAKREGELNEKAELLDTRATALRRASLVANNKKAKKN